MMGEGRLQTGRRGLPNIQTKIASSTPEYTEQSTSVHLLVWIWYMGGVVWVTRTKDLRKHYFLS